MTRQPTAPKEETIALPDGQQGTVYTLEIWEDVLYHDDPCFATEAEPNRRTRELKAQELAEILKKQAESNPLERILEEPRPPAPTGPAAEAALPAVVTAPVNPDADGPKG